MSKKSKKKAKKPKPLDIKVLSAKEIDYYIRNKFEIANDEFWEWFFSECPWGETTILSLNEEDYYPDEYNSEKYAEYVQLIRDEFEEYADEEHTLEIEHDF